MDAKFLIYPGTAEFNEENQAKTASTLIPVDTSCELITTSNPWDDLESLLSEPNPDFILFFQQAGVTNTPTYVGSAKQVVEKGASLGCANWTYDAQNIPFFLRANQTGCNVASRNWNIIHNNGIITRNALVTNFPERKTPNLFSDLSNSASRNKAHFAYLSAEMYKIPIPPGSPFMNWLNSDLMMVYQAGKRYLGQ